MTDKDQCRAAFEAWAETQGLDPSGFDDASLCGLPQGRYNDLMTDAAGVAWSHLSAELAASREREARLRGVCAEAYQLAGFYDAPVEALDNLSAAANGMSLPHETFLPIVGQSSAPASEPLER